MAEQGYRVPEVCKIVGITYRQLDYWARTGPGPAVGQGRAGLGHPAPVLVPGPRHAQADQADARQRGEPPADPQGDEDPARASKEPALGTTLVSDGNRIYQVESPEAVVDLLASGQGVFAIAVDKVWTDLEGTLAKSGREEGSRRSRGRRRVTEGAAADDRRP